MPKSRITFEAMLYTALKPILFAMQPERAHAFTMKLLDITSSLPGGKALLNALGDGGDTRSVEAFGLQFRSRIGLAAGFDKDARHLPVWKALGFGFAEVGTLTPQPQPGNERPRLFRLVPDQALINRMGFNNAGVASAAARLKKRPADFVVGGNVGKNKVTPNSHAVQDYLLAMKQLYGVVDYFTVNISSPNTPGLRELQERDQLAALLGGIQQFVRQQSERKPVLVKIAPDMTDHQLGELINLCVQFGISGLVATNTTINRSGLVTAPTRLEEIGFGGVSGAPVKQRSTDVIRFVVRQAGKSLPVVGVGGIMSPRDALEKLESGAILLQLYTGFVYGGPDLLKQSLKTLYREGY